MNEAAFDHRLGTAALSPDADVVAGERVEWTLVYTVGSYGIDEGGTIKIARRFASDMERPQFEDPKAPAYTTVHTSGEAKLAARYDPKAHVRPWMKCVVIDVYDGTLYPGDTVTIVFGDRRGGSPGIRVQSFVESKHEIRVLVDPTNACLVRRLPSSPVIAVRAGPPVEVVPIVPSRARVGAQIEVFVKGQDRWGNPTPAPQGTTLRWEGDGELELRGDQGAARARAAGTGVVVATFDGVRHESNPLTIESASQGDGFGRHWAELHAQSDATVGTGTEEEYFTFARDWARVDVASHQGNDFQVDDEVWAHLNRVTAEFQEDGRFVVFPGFEWSANTGAGGDRNVFYLEEGLPIMRSSHWQIGDTPETDSSPAHPADELCRRLRAQVPERKFLVAAHCGGRYADIVRYFDPEIERLVEVSSCWGIFEWLLWDAFERGYRVGIMASSDGHKGRPGAEGPGAGQFGIYGGLTCILSESLTRESVFEALRARRCYGTTGPRIDLEFAVDGHCMGSEFDAEKGQSVEVRAEVRGTAPIDRLELYAGRERIASIQPGAFDGPQSRRVRVAWGGARIRGRGRRAIWDGVVSVRGCRIERAETFSFDSPLDGIESTTETELRFRSRTTGDVDGIDLWLDAPGSGTVRFASDVGDLEVDLATLGREPARRELGGLDLFVEVSRYPEDPQERNLVLEHSLELTRAVPLFVRAVQVDGHMAWASPVYVDV